MKTKIAVTYENGDVFQHFGHTKEFKFYTVEDGKIVDTQIVPTMGSGHSLLADFLLLNGATVLICGGIGGGAKAALAAKGIELRGGVSGNADEKALFHTIVDTVILAGSHILTCKRNRCLMKRIHRHVNKAFDISCCRIPGNHNSSERIDR